MANPAFATFLGNGTWTAPAGVTSVTVSAQYPRNNVLLSAASFVSLDQNGVAFSVGDNTNGQLGNNTSTAQSSPVQVVGGLRFNSLGIVSGDRFPVQNTCMGIDNTGKAWAWGDDASNQLGDGASTSRSSPVAVLGNLSLSALNYSFGTNIGVIGTTTAGVLYAWGGNTSGRLGTGDTANKTSPVKISSALTFAQVVMHQQTSYALSITGAAYAWGENTNGQLGLGDVTPRSSPVAVLGGLTFAKLIQSNVEPSTSLSMYAVQNDGTLYGWGINNNGQLGLGDVTPRSSPVAVLGGLKFKQFAVIQNTNTTHSIIALTFDGTAYAWGSNQNGQLGLGDVTPRSSPVAVLGGLKFTQISCDNTQNFWGITEDGTAYGWGRNNGGVLGVGNTVSRSSPVAVVGGLKFAKISAAFDQINDSWAMGISLDGKTYAWGSNAAGQLGDNSTTNRSSPVLSLANYSTLVYPSVTQTVIPVIPGTTYTLSMLQQLPTFNNVNIGSGVPSLVTLYFEE